MKTTSNTSTALAVVAYALGAAAVVAAAFMWTSTPAAAQSAGITEHEKFLVAAVAVSIPCELKLTSYDAHSALMARAKADPAVGAEVAALHSAAQRAVLASGPKGSPQRREFCAAMFLRGGDAVAID